MLSDADIRLVMQRPSIKVMSIKQHQPLSHLPITRFYDSLCTFFAVTPEAIVSLSCLFKSCLPQVGS